ncbi:hypothetical protein C0989_011516 [Termitomyces sp. Mn162]|nr:hypothetical protein C0989_011516 [Termitomyces sp. Mn162]
MGDQIYTTTIHPPPSVAEIQASQTTSQWLAQVFAANNALQEFQDVMPSYFHGFEDVFSKALFDLLLECKRAAEMDPVKVAGVAEWPELKNKEGQAFLSFVNFYQRFIQDFSHHAHPLFDLIGKDVA